MANKKVTIWKSIRLGNQWRYVRPVVGPNNKIKPGWVKVNGHQEFHKEGQYFLHYLEGKKQVWAKCGPLPTTAVEMATRKEAVLRAVAAGITVQPEFKTPLLLREALGGYLEEYRLSKRPESYALMKQTLEEWLVFSKKYVAHDVKRIDLLKYKAWLIENGREPRTAGNKMMRVAQFLRKIQGIEPGKFFVSVKDAKFTELEPVVYHQEELDKFFAACTPFQLLVFKTYLMSGLRKQELEHLEWTDVNFTVGTLTVSPKPGFDPKDWEQRTIEIPTELPNLLKPHAKPSGYVFPTSTGNRWTHSWDACKEIERRAGLTGFHPHGFRATFATTCLQGGMDLKTVQKLLGHKDLESTQRYLAKAQSHTVRARLDSIWNGRH
jgi:integrase